jgi:hypothetical protein
MNLSNGQAGKKKEDESNHDASTDTPVPGSKTGSNWPGANSQAATTKIAKHRLDGGLRPLPPPAEKRGL